MPYDKTTERIRQNLNLGIFEGEKRPKVVAYLQSILANLDDSKFYPQAR